MKKFLVCICTGLLLVGCGNKVDENKSVNVTFKDELAVVSDISEKKGRHLVDELLIGDIDKIFEDIFSYAVFESTSVEYGELMQGAGNDGNGGRIFCCKLPVNVRFTGTEDSIKKFVEYFDELESVISFGDFKITPIEDEKYEVLTTISFLGKDAGGNLNNGKNEYTIKKNQVEKDVVEDTTLRNFDISMILRPSNSDSAAISLGVVNEKDSRVYSDENLRQKVKVTFGNSGNSYYAEYSIGDEESIKATIKPKDKILFDILSCSVVESDDSIAVDLSIVNNSNKKVSVFTYEDNNKRINFVDKVGSIEVKEK